ncbi:MAG: TerB N-terminal domain-containing protein [Oscillospiraceae bacterium]|jgi:hypothetical protein|nr:TerB N-terminal domain-containing protein [Oscillospiraceae bacterium]
MATKPNQPPTDSDSTLLALMNWSDYKYEQNQFFSKYPFALTALRDMFLGAMRNLMPLFTSHGVSLDALTRSGSLYMTRNTPPRSVMEMAEEVDPFKLFLGYIGANGINGPRDGTSRRQADTILPCRDARMVTSYIIRILEIRLRAKLKHSPIKTPSRERIIQEISYMYQHKTPRLDLALEDERFDTLLNEAAQLYINNSADLRLTCPLDDPRLISPLSREIDEANRQEPFATLIRFHSERLLGYSEQHFADLFRRQANVIAGSGWIPPRGSTSFGDDGQPADASPRPPELPQADTQGYSQLTDSQLLGYIAWRVSYRSGGEPPAPAEAVLLCATELLHGVGADNPHEIMAGLARLLSVYAKVSRKVTNRLTAWIRDLYVLNYIKNPAKVIPPRDQRRQAVPAPADPSYGFALPFTAYVERYGLSRFYPALLMGVDVEKSLAPEQRFELYASVSAYKVTASKIYAAPYIPLLKACFAAALDSVQGLLDASGGFDLLMLAKRSGNGLRLYDTALTYDRVVYRVPRDAAPIRARLSIDARRKPEPLEQFVRRQNGWFCRSFATLTPIAPVLAGWLMRSLDSHLREMIRFPSKLQRPAFITDNVTCILSRARLGAASIGLLESLPMDAAVKQAVGRTLHAMYPNGFTAPDAKPAKRAKRGAAIDEATIERTPVKVDFSTLERARMDADWVFSRLTAKSGEDENDSIPAVQPAPKPLSLPLEALSFDDDASNALDSWTALAAALTDIERDALSTMLDNPAPTAALRAFAQRQNQLPAAFVERINGKALDLIGDTLIEDMAGYRVIDDYRGDCAAMCAKREPA